MQFNTLHLFTHNPWKLPVCCNGVRCCNNWQALCALLFLRCGIRLWQCRIIYATQRVKALNFCTQRLSGSFDKPSMPKRLVPFPTCIELLLRDIRLDIWLPFVRWSAVKLSVLMRCDGAKGVQIEILLVLLLKWLAVGIAVGIWRVSFDTWSCARWNAKANYVLTNTLNALDMCRDMKLANQQ